MKINTFFFALLLSVPSLLFSCKIQKEAAKLNIFTAEEYCQISPPTIYLYDSYWLKKIESDTVSSVLVSKRFSERARSVAADIGLLAALNSFSETEKLLKQNKSDSLKIKFIAIRQEILEQINLASLEVASVLSEIECEQDRAIELKYYLEEKVAKRTRKLTILSIMAGAVSTALASVLTLSEVEQPYIETAVSGGAVLSAYWALRTLGIDAKEYFVHKRNHLKDIWDRPPYSEVYPPMVWHFLTREFEISDKTPIVCDIVIERWNELDLLGKGETKEHKRRITLFFSEGGIYNLEDIDNRISLIDLLETEINLMNQELKLLQQEVLLPKNE